MSEKFETIDQFMARLAPDRCVACAAALKPDEDTLCDPCWNTRAEIADEISTAPSATDVGPDDA